MNKKIRGLTFLYLLSIAFLVTVYAQTVYWEGTQSTQQVITYGASATFNPVSLKDTAKDIPSDQLIEIPLAVQTFVPDIYLILSTPNTVYLQGYYDNLKLHLRLHGETTDLGVLDFLAIGNAIAYKITTEGTYQYDYYFEWNAIAVVPPEGMTINFNIDIKLTN